MNTEATCVKTGAQIYVEQYGYWVVTDLFRLNDTWFFLVLTRDHIRPKPHPGMNLHGTVGQLALPLTRLPPPFTMIASDAGFVYHGYDGILPLR